ncbi:hypothetical protein Ahia01_000137000 [Argonauta hians]
MEIYYSDPDDSRPFQLYLNSLYLDNNLCDIELKAGSIVISAHRIVLASASDYFKNQFENQIDGVLDLTEIFADPNTLKQIINYIYSGEITLTKDMCISLLKILDQIDLKSLKEHCAQFLFEGLHPINAFTIWELAWRHKLHQLASVCLVFCCETLCNQIVKADNIKELSVEFLIFFHETVAIPLNFNIGNVLKLNIQWLSHDPTNRLKDSSDLFEIILQNTCLLRREYEDVNLFKNEYDKNVQRIISTNILPLLRRYIIDIPNKNSPIKIEHCSTPFDNRANSDRYGLMTSPEISECSPPKRTRNNSLQYCIEASGRIMKLNRPELQSEMILRSLGNPREDYNSGWNVVVQEDRIPCIGLYCSYSNTWWGTYFPLVIHNPIGRVKDFLACEQEHSVIILYNIKVFSWMLLPSPIASIENKCNDLCCLTGYKPSFFTCSESLYSICAVFNKTNNKLSFLLSKWEFEDVDWIFLTRIYPTQDVTDCLLVSSSVKTSNNSIVYLMTTVETIRERRKKTSQSEENHTDDTADIRTSRSSTDADSKQFDNEQSETKCSMRPSERFYVFKIDLETLTSEEIGVRFSEPTNLDQVPALILSDRILFILDSKTKIDEYLKFALSFDKPFYVNGLELFVANNTWKRILLGVPLPSIDDFPIRKSGRRSFAHYISFSKHLVVVGIHRAPYVFQVSVYDVQRRKLTTLSSTPLPALNKMTVFLINGHNTLGMTYKSNLKEVDESTCYFQKYHLKSWRGIAD